jgi:hypothetical protein
MRRCLSFLPYAFSRLPYAIGATCSANILARRSERGHMVTGSDQHPRHILRHAASRNLRSAKEAINDQHLHTFKPLHFPTLH